MHLMQSNHQGETTMTVTIDRIPCTSNKPHALAVFKYHDQHRIVLRSDLSVTCDTCSLSATAAAAAAFMYANGVITLTIDGATLKRI